MVQLGDWVQAVKSITDDGEEVARPGDLGHVVSEVESDGWPNVYFERTGRVNTCHPREVIFIAHADAGKANERTPTHVN